VLNANDKCPQTPLEEAVNAFGGPLGDFNANCIVNLVDYARMQPCLNQSGPGGSGEPTCLNVFDFDADGDVDLRDFAGMQQAIGE
jgi:hypothetical protein